MKCEITGCGRDADRLVTYCHPEESSRWSANLCREHAREAADTARGGAGELVYGPPKEVVT